MLKPDQRSEEDKRVQISTEESCKMQKCDPGAQRRRTEKQLDADETETKHPDKDQVLPAGRAVYPPRPDRKDVYNA